MDLFVYLIICLHCSKCGHWPMYYRSMTGKNRNRKQALKNFYSNLTKSAEFKKIDICILCVFFSNDSCLLHFTNVWIDHTWWVNSGSFAPLPSQLGAGAGSNLHNHM